MRSRAVLLGALLSWGAFPLEAQMATGFLDRAVTLDTGEHRYQVYVPRGYDPGRPWPVILFLHGAGERGADGLLQTEVGLGSAVRRFPDRYPAIIVFPQTPAGETFQGIGSRIALAALDQTIGEFHVDSNRVYLTGLSLGGNGAWYLAYHHRDRFAALVVVCGWVGGRGQLPSIVPGADDPYTALAARLAGLPIQIFHGDADPRVPVDESRRMAAALKGAGVAVTYTELPGVGHNAWDVAFRSEALAAWLLQQRRP